ncbi:MAG: GTPase domain-containing protein [Hyphomicrobiaceae bacterium]
MRRDSLSSYVGVAAIVLGAGLPLLVLVPFGWLWLWQHGYVLHWFAAALAVSLGAFAMRAWLLRRLRKEMEAADLQAAAADLAGSPRESAARATVDRLARDVDPKRITDREALTALGLETIEAVARHMHPNVEHAVWSFTVPEALTLLERVSQRLRPLVVENVPLGDRLTVGQVMQLYQWRGLIDVANTAYDIWRIIRLMNPLAAATQEIRERLSKTMYEGLREELAKRLAAAYVREVGRAAIDLYSGRLAVPTAETGVRGVATAETVDGTAPLRLLLAGRAGSGKSSLVNALADEVQAATDALPQTRTFTAYEVQNEGMPPVLLVDTPGLTRAEMIPPLAEKAAECDLIVWVAAADRPDRDLDRSALEAVRVHFSERLDRPAPPVVVVLTHVDRLRPFQEWSPPYDIADPAGPKARSIRDAVDAAGEHLARPVDRVVPVCLSPERGLYNIDLVWAELVEALPAAKSAQLLRRIASAKRGMDWRRVLSQAAGAGRLVAGALLRGR